MKLIAQFRLNPGMKNKAVEYFEQRGPNRNPGVTFLGAWVGKDTDVAFVLLEASSVDLVQAGGQAWSEFGTFELHPVLDIQQF
jgi:hypothetical protein